MNKGSKKITVRVGGEMYDAIKERCHELNDHTCPAREWTLTEFVVQAVVEKLNHLNRSRGSCEKVSHEKVDDFLPRVWGE